MNILKELREKKGVYQKDVAKFMGVDRTTYVKWENGITEPNNESLAKLADYFNVTTDYLLSYEKNNIGKNIKHIRKEKKLTQKELGDLCGLTETQISRYERNKIIPTFEILDKISYALDVSITELKKDITWEECKNTLLMKQLDRMTSAIEGIIALLGDIYENIEEKNLQGKYGESFYYVIGKEKKFVLYEPNINDIYEAVKSLIPFLVNSMKDTRAEEEIIKECLVTLNTPRAEFADVPTEQLLQETEARETELAKRDLSASQKQDENTELA